MRELFHGSSILCALYIAMTPAAQTLGIIAMFVFTVLYFKMVFFR